MATTNTPDDATVAAPDDPTSIGAGTGTDSPIAAVWGALTANPGGSAADIAAAAGMSKAATRRALGELQSDGRATRTPGGRDGGKRAPDAWHTTNEPPATEPPATEATDPGTVEDHDTAPVKADEAPGEQLTDAPNPVATTDENASDAPPPGPQTPPEDGPDTTTGPDNGNGEPGTTEDGLDATAVADAQAALMALGAEIVSALDAVRGGNRTEALTAAEEIYAGSGKARRLVRAAANGRPRSASGKAKSHPGELRAKVEAHLAAYPDQEFTPHEIGKAIGHSAGAVANALDRLATEAKATETCDRPRRFKATTPGADNATTATK